MISNYVNLGMPKGPDGFDQDVCLSWIQEHMAPTGRGGKWDRKDKEVGGVRAGTAATFKQLQTKRLEAKVKREQLDLERAEGRALDRATTLSSVRAHLTVVRQRVEKIAPDAAKAVAAEFGIEAERMPQLRSVLEGVVAKAMGDIQRQPIPIPEGPS